MTLSVKNTHSLTFICQYNIKILLSRSLILYHSLHASPNSTGPGWSLSLILRDITSSSSYHQLHDLSTRELSTRIGGAKTGLMNASMVKHLMVSRMTWHSPLPQFLICNRATCRSLCLVLSATSLTCVFP